jgi:hypothetical protein
MEDKSVASQIISMEDASGEKVVSSIKNTKSKLPINMYFEKTTKGQVKFMGSYMEIYIPKDEIERKNTVISGREVYTYGIFQMKFWDKIPENPDTDPPVYTTRYMYPSTFTTVPSSILTKTISLVGDEPQPCLVLGYHKNDIFIKSLTLAQASDVAARFVQIVNKAFISPIVRYPEIMDLIFESAKLNGVNFGVNATTMEIMIAAQARYAKDLTIPYRKYLNQKGTGDSKIDAAMLKFVKSTDLPHIMSTFTAFSFQDIDYAITASSRRHRKGLKQKESNVEKIIKY